MNDNISAIYAPQQPSKPLAQNDKTLIHHPWQWCSEDTNPSIFFLTHATIYSLLIWPKMTVFQSMHFLQVLCGVRCMIYVCHLWAWRLLLKHECCSSISDKKAWTALRGVPWNRRSHQNCRHYCSAIKMTISENAQQPINWTFLHRPEMNHSLFSSLHYIQVVGTHISFTKPCAECLEKWFFYDRDVQLWTYRVQHRRVLFSNTKNKPGKGTEELNQICLSMEINFLLAVIADVQHICSKHSFWDLIFKESLRNQHWGQQHFPTTTYTRRSKAPDAQQGFVDNPKLVQHRSLGHSPSIMSLHVRESVITMGSFLCESISNLSLLPGGSVSIML